MSPLARKRLKSRRQVRPNLTRIVAILHGKYGSPDHNNKRDPLDELIFIILSQMTTYHSYERVYDRLRGAVASWAQLTKMPVRSIQSLIKDAGLSGQKAPRIKAIVMRLQRDFGKVTLDALRDMPDDQAEAYLKSLPGVGTKTARCVLMYSLNRRVLPVDTHVDRVARRLGLRDRNDTGNRHDTLANAVAPRFRYAFHVNAIPLGRDTCRALRPRCSECVIQRYCVSARPRNS